MIRVNHLCSMTAPPFSYFLKLALYIPSDRLPGLNLVRTWITTPIFPGYFPRILLLVQLPDLNRTRLRPASDRLPGANLVRTWITRPYLPGISSESSREARPGPNSEDPPGLEPYDRLLYDRLPGSNLVRTWIPRPYFPGMLVISVSAGAKIKHPGLEPYAYGRLHTGLS